MAAISTIAAVATAGAAVAGAAASAKNGKAANATAKGAADSQLAIAQRQEDRADEQYQNYRENYLPAQQQLLSEAKGRGSIANQNVQAQQAAADVAAGFAGAREQLNETPGLNPNSDAYLRQANRINLTEAATSAAAQTGARQQTRDKGDAALRDAASIGAGLPGTSSALLAQAGAGFGSAATFAERQRAAAEGSVASSMGAAGRVVGGLSQSKSFNDWMNGVNSAGSGSPPNPYYTGGVPANPNYAGPSNEELQFAGAGAFA